MRHARVVALLGALLLVASACDFSLITNIREGQIIDAPTIHVEGVLAERSPDGGVLTVNGIPTSFGARPSRAWSQDVPRSAGIVTEIEVLYVVDGIVWDQQRRGVVNGPSIAEGSPSPNGVGLNFTNSGLSGLGPVVKGLAGGAFDIGGLLMAQNPIIANQEVIAGTYASGYVREAGVDGIDIGLTTTPGGTARANITISDLFLGMDVYISGGLSSTCGLEIQIPTVNIVADFDLRPDATDASKVDVNMVGSPTTTIPTVNYEFINGICDSSSFLIGGIINSVAGSTIESSVRSGFSTKLGDPDGAGPLDSPLAEAIEGALANISIAGSVGTAVKANLDAPFTSITESANGIDMRADADFSATLGNGPGECAAVPNAPDLAETYDVSGTFPNLPAVTPVGNEPYGLGLTISASAFNQLLSAMTECGLITQDITELSLGGPPVPVTSSVLAGFDPAFAAIGPNVPMKIRVKPTVAPFITAEPGPNGAMAELALANLLIEFLLPTNVEGTIYDIPRVIVAIEAPLGLTLGFDPVLGQLAPTIAAPAVSDVTARVVLDHIGANDAGIEALFPNVFPLFVSGLSSGFAAFPLPEFLGLQLNVLEIQRANNHFVVYANLDATEQTRIENAVLVDTSTGDVAVDSAFDAREWRHRIKKSLSSPTSLSAQYKAIIAADACCTVDDEEQSAQARYQFEFDVIPENGETWRLDLAHNISGAHSIKDEWAACEDAGGRTEIPNNGGYVRGNILRNGVWSSFSFTPSDLGASTPVRWGCGGHSGNKNEAFTGSASTFLTGTSAEHIVVQFHFDLFAKSDSNAAGPAAGGDEVAIRLGANDSVTNGIDVGQYPGYGNRDINLDGHFASVTLTTIP